MDLYVPTAGEGQGALHLIIIIAALLNDERQRQRRSLCPCLLCERCINREPQRSRYIERDQCFLAEMTEWKRKRKNNSKQFFF